MHTPTPWRIETPRNSRGQVLTARIVGPGNTGIIATLGIPGQGHRDDNAQLLLAAPDLVAALQAALQALQADVAGDCPHCNGEGSWTDQPGSEPRPTPVRHKTDCPITLAQAALRAAARSEATPCR